MPSNIGIAFEDVISENPDLWSDFMKYCRLEGHSIFVVGNDPTYTIVDQLDHKDLHHQVHWDKVVSVYSMLSSKGADVYFNEFYDCWCARDMQTWYNVKARICFENKISIMFEVNPHFFTAFNSVVTRLVNVDILENIKMVKDTVTKLKAMNTWFDEYEDEEFAVTANRG